jgi:hypothetical protein
LNLVGIFSGEIDGDLLIVGAYNENFARSDVKMDGHIRRAIKFHMRFPGNSTSDLVVAYRTGTNKSSRASARAERFIRTPPVA